MALQTTGNTDAAPETRRLRMAGIRKSFGATKALAGVDLSVGAGQVLALVGENGAGKSTLMKVLSGAHRADAGEMFLEGKPYQPREPLDARRAGVAMIYQELSLARHLSVKENIMLGMEPTFGPFMDWAAVRRRGADALEQMGHGNIALDRPVGQYSIAIQQVVEIARAVAVGSRLLVLDEPTSSLTSGDIDKLFALIERLKAQGHSVIYISHFLEEVKRIGDRYTVLRDGKSVGSGRVADVDSDQLIALMVGRNVAELYPRSVHKTGEVALEIRGVAGREKPRQASLTLRRGEVVGIAGLIGAGRTELLRALFGLDAVVRGAVRVGRFSGPGAGADITGSGATAVSRGITPARRWRDGVGMVSEDRKTEGLALTMSIADNITMPGMRTFVNPAKQNAGTREWIRRMAVRCRGPMQRVGDLSGGNQQKVAIARLLDRDVDVLLLDEPTRGIDVGSKAQIYQLIDELACSGKAVLMVSSYLPELMGTCDRVAVMCRGVLGEARPVAEINEHQIMLEATGTGEIS